MKKINNIQTNILIFASMILISFLYVYSFYRTGIIFVAHDRIFHMERMEEIYQSVKHGHLFNQVSTYSAKSVGIAIGRFYPSVNLIIYALIRLCIHNPFQSVYGFIFIESILGLGIAFYAGNIFFKNKKLAYLFSISLRLSTYVMHNDFARFDLGESWASVFVPLALIGFYLILKEDRSIKGIILLSLGISFELYSHILTAVITVISIIIMYVIFITISNNLDLKKLGLFFISAIITVVNTLIVTIPIIDYYLNVGIVEPFKMDWNMYDLSLVNVFNTSIENTISSPNIGIFGVVAIILMLIVTGKQSKSKKNNMVVIYIIIFLLMITNLFPWNVLTNTPMNIIQFPWRFLLVLVPLISIMFAYTLDKKIDLNLKKIVVIIFLNVMLTISTQNMFIQNEYKNYSYISSTTQLKDPWGNLIRKNDYDKVLTIDSLNINYGYKDYLPKKSEKVHTSIYNLEIIQKNWKRKLHENEIKRSYHKITYNLSQLPKKSGEMKIPFIIYKNSDYRLLINEKRVKVKSDKNGQLVINKDNKSKVKVEITYVVPLLHKVLLVVSTISVLVNIIVLFIIKYRNNK